MSNRGSLFSFLIDPRCGPLCCICIEPAPAAAFAHAGRRDNHFLQLDAPSNFLDSTIQDEDRWRAAIGHSQRGGSLDVLLARASEETLKRFSRELGIYQTEDLMRLFELVIKYGIRFYQLPWAVHFFHEVPFDYPHETCCTC